MTSLQEPFVPKSNTRALIRAEIQKFTDDVIAPAMADAIVKLIEERCSALEAKIKRLEAAASEFKFVGAWDQVKQYRCGNFISFGGGIWHCNADTREKPGVNGDWVLAVPKGRDGRDGKDYVPPPPPEPRTVRSHHR